MRVKSWERETFAPFDLIHFFFDCELYAVHLNEIDKLVLNIFLLIRNFNAIIQTVRSNSLSRVR